MSIKAPVKKRAIWCPACGRKLVVPASAAIGRKVRCGICTVTFAIPDWPKRAEPERTGAGQVDLNHLPKALRDLVGPLTEQPAAKPSAGRPASPLSEAQKAERIQKAFDLDRLGRIKRRTGVCMFNTDELPLPFDE